MFYGTQKLFCPVHPDDEGFLGNRSKNSAVWLKCTECRVYYFFPAQASTPTKNKTVKSMEVKCGCGGCDDRDFKKRLME